MIIPTVNDVSARTPVTARVDYLNRAAWQDMVRAWRRADADLVPIRDRFDAAEQRWRTSRTDPLAAAALDQATRLHERQLALCDVALDALLDTRAPDLSAVLWKLGIVTNRLGPDMPADLRFLVPDLRSVETIHAARMAGGTHAGV